MLTFLYGIFYNPVTLWEKILCKILTWLIGIPLIIPIYQIIIVAYASHMLHMTGWGLKETLMKLIAFIILWCTGTGIVITFLLESHGCEAPDENEDIHCE